MFELLKIDLFLCIQASSKILQTKVAKFFHNEIKVREFSVHITTKINIKLICGIRKY